MSMERILAMQKQRFAKEKHVSQCTSTINDDDTATAVQRLELLRNNHENETIETHTEENMYVTNKATNHRKSKQSQNDETLENIDPQMVIFMKQTLPTLHNSSTQSIDCEFCKKSNANANANEDMSCIVTNPR